MLHTPAFRATLLLLWAAASLAACDTTSPSAPLPEAPSHPSESELHTAELHHGALVLDGRATIAANFQHQASIMLESEQPIWRIGLRYDATLDPNLEASFERNGVWSDWTPVEITFSESGAYNARVLLETPATRAALRSTRPEAEGLTFLYAETYTTPFPEVLPEVELPEAPTGEFVTLTQAIAPADIVIPRSAWGARAARNSGSCPVAHNPNYITIHHTVGPTVDSLSPEARLRQIQNYHMDTNGWCDIGYHFLVSADGRVWQGREDEQRIGIHVGGNNTNNVGISFMGSYHIDQVPEPMLPGAAPLVRWLADTYAIPLNRTYVLGHREWGNSTQCPGSFLLARLEELIDLADNPTPSDAGVDITVGWNTIANQARDLVASGSSSGVFDTLVGQSVKGAIVVRNGAERPATDNVQIGYWIQDPWLEPVSYLIEHDRPALDGATWTRSSANDHPDNPPADALPAEGILNIGVLQPGESARIVVTLRAAEYSFGAVDHPDLRAWVKHIGSYYGEQNGWDDPVETNRAGRLLRDFAQLDVFAPDFWAFDGPDGDDLEGWSARKDISDIALNLTDGALAAKASGTDPYIASPAWTRIDTARSGAVRIRARQHGATREGQLFWKRDGESFAEARSVTFNTTGNGVFDDVILDLSDHPEWTGIVTGLRIDPWDGGPFTAAEAWFDIDLVEARPGNTPPTGEDVAQPGDTNAPPEDTATPGSDAGLGDVPTIGMDTATETGADAGADTTDPEFQVQDGCGCSTVRDPARAPWALASGILLGLMVLRRRQTNAA